VSLKLPAAPGAYDQTDQVQVRGALERADRQSLKRGTDLDLGAVSLSLSSGGNAGGARLYVDVDETAQNVVQAASSATGITHLLATSGLGPGGGSDAFGAYDSGGLSARIQTNGYYQSRPNAYGSISDARIKQNIVDATPKLAELMLVKVRNYELNATPGEKHIGVVAQEIEAIWPTLVHETPAAPEDHVDTPTIKAVKYSVLTPILIKAVQELAARVQALEAAAPAKA
jgi:hypothetical protein